MSTFGLPAPYPSAGGGTYGQAAARLDDTGKVEGPDPHKLKHPVYRP